jgi:3-oxoacyl-[acyl-carrier protein] reductase
MFSLAGKNALITGATGGIGAAITRTLHAAGANVFITGTRDHVLQSTKQELMERCDYLAGDIADPAFIESLFKAAEERTGGVDILICNAGITRDNLIMRMKDEEWQEVMRVNLDAVFKLNRAAVKAMIRRRYGRIINISSITGCTGNAGQANYTAAKAALIGMSKSIAHEVASRNVTVNCIAPGFITSPMTDELKPEIKEAMLNRIPMNRFGAPQDIAASCLFLAASEASYITGQTMHVNGGMYMA